MSRGRGNATSKQFFTDAVKSVNHPRLEHGVEAMRVDELGKAGKRGGRFVRPGTTKCQWNVRIRLAFAPPRSGCVQRRKTAWLGRRLVFKSDDLGH